LRKDSAFHIVCAVRKNKVCDAEMMGHFVFDSVFIITDFYFDISYFPYFSINLSFSKRHCMNSFQKLFVFPEFLFYIHSAIIDYMILSFFGDSFHFYQLL